VDFHTEPKYIQKAYTSLPEQKHNTRNKQKYTLHNYFNNNSSWSFNIITHRLKLCVHEIVLQLYELSYIPDDVLMWPKHVANIYESMNYMVF
jgi:hypothetical protein